MFARFLNESKVFSMQDLESNNNVKKIFKNFHLNFPDLKAFNILSDGKSSLFSLLLNDELLIYTVPSAKKCSKVLILSKDEGFNLIASATFKSPSSARNCLMTFAKTSDNLEHFKKNLEKFKFNTVSLHLAIFLQKIQNKNEINESLKLMTGSDFASDFIKFYEKTFNPSIKIPNTFLTDKSPGFYCVGFEGNIIAYTDSSVTNTITVHAVFEGKLGLPTPSLLGILSVDDTRKLKTIMVAISKVINKPPDLKKVLQNYNFEHMMKSNWDSVLYRYSRYKTDFITKSKFKKG